MTSQSLKGKKSMIKLNPMWKEVEPTDKDKEVYKKVTGLNMEKILIMKDKYWDKLNKILYEKHT